MRWSKCTWHLINLLDVQLNEAIQGHEIEVKMEEPVVQQLDAEVRDLEQQIQIYNKQQMSLKTHAKELKDEIDAVNNQVLKYI